MTINKARLAAQLSPFGTDSGELQKLTIHYEQYSGARPGRIEALFNPGEISVSRSAGWEPEPSAGHGGTAPPGPQLEFQSVEPATLVIELFFDTYETRSDALDWTRAALPPVPGGVVSRRTATDVRRHTDRIVRLAKVDRELHRPPVCRLWWGRNDIFQGVLINVDQTFTMFLEDGLPVRATLGCTFLEAATVAEGRANERHSSDVARTRRLARNDTLQDLAAREYGDPARWREIARANGVVNPRRLRPGDTVLIPRLQGGAP